VRNALYRASRPVRSILAEPLRGGPFPRVPPPPSASGARPKHHSLLARELPLRLKPAGLMMRPFDRPPGGRARAPYGGRGRRSLPGRTKPLQGRSPRAICGHLPKIDRSLPPAWAWRPASGRRGVRAPWGGPPFRLPPRLLPGRGWVRPSSFPQSIGPAASPPFRISMARFSSYHLPSFGFCQRVSSPSRNSGSHPAASNSWCASLLS
jgi:hypothetical protein